MAGDGDAVTSERSGAWRRKDRQTQTARGVVIAAGALGTNQLLERCRLRRLLPGIETAREMVRTNSEAIVVVTADRRDTDFGEGIGSARAWYPDPHTHIETVTYGSVVVLMKLLYTCRPGRQIVDQAVSAGWIVMIRSICADTFAGRLVAPPITLLATQTLDNAIALRARPRRFGGGVRLRTEQDAERPNPTFIPVANQAAEMLAKQIDGVAQSNVSEALANIPTTAHILGGAVIAADPDHGVIDQHERVFGYQNLLVCDGAAVPANVGVNPSLTITALAEHAMNHIPAADSRYETHATEEVLRCQAHQSSRSRLFRSQTRICGARGRRTRSSASCADAVRCTGAPGSRNRRGTRGSGR